MSDTLARTPEPPYLAVIFTSVLSGDADGYAEMSEMMDKLASLQDGYLGHDSARNASGLGITVSYWRDLDAISAWRDQAQHQVARQLGRESWMDDYRLRVATVERASNRAAEQLRLQREVD